MINQVGSTLCPRATNAAAPAITRKPNASRSKPSPNFIGSEGFRIPAGQMDPHSSHHRCQCDNENWPDSLEPACGYFETKISLCVTIREQVKRRPRLFEPRPE